MFKTINFLFFFLTLVNSKKLYLNNYLDSDIVVNVLGYNNFEIPAGGNVTVTTSDTYTGLLSGKPVDCIQEACSLFPTVVAFAFSPSLEGYMISILTGFNLPVTIIPEPQGSCKSISCARRELFDDCPEENKVFVDDKIVACKNSPELFQKHCATSFIIPDEDKMVSCPDEVGYTVNFGFEN